MRKNIVEPDRLHMTIWRMRIACWIPKSIDTLSIYDTYYFSTATMAAREHLSTNIACLGVPSSLPLNHIQSRLYIPYIPVLSMTQITNSKRLRLNVLNLVSNVKSERKHWTLQFYSFSYLLVKMHKTIPYLYTTCLSWQTYFTVGAVSSLVTTSPTGRFLGFNLWSYNSLS
jgi:hypothetical protein